MRSGSADVGFARAATLKRVHAVLNLAQMICGTWARRSPCKDPSLRSQLLVTATVIVVNRLGREPQAAVDASGYDKYCFKMFTLRGCKNASRNGFPRGGFSSGTRSRTYPRSGN